MWWLLIDAIVVAILAFFVVTSARKGFVKAVLDLAAFIAAFFLASTLSGIFAGWAYDSFAGDRLTATIETELNNAVDVALVEALPDYIVSGAQAFGIYDDILLSQRDTVSETAVMIVENVAKPVITGLVRMISSVIIFMILMFIFRIIIRAVNKLFKLPVIKGVNMFLGGILGGCKGSIAVLLLCLIISVVAVLSGGSFWIFTPENIEKTILFKLIYNSIPSIGL